MKYFIFSDIHGSATCCEKALNEYSRHNCDMIICLGDLLYHGARNPLPEGYDNPAVCNMLNPLADKIITCRGNCDSEVCEMVLNFPVMQDYCFVTDGNTRIFASHGHVYSPAKDDGTPLVNGSKLPQPLGWDIMLYGHTHISELYRDSSNRIICNPGSISLPKNGTEKGYAIYEDGNVSLYNLNGDLLRES